LNGVVAGAKDRDNEVGFFWRQKESRAQTAVEVGGITEDRADVCEPLKEGRSRRVLGDGVEIGEEVSSEPAGV